MAKNTGRVCYGEICFTVEIARTFFKKAFGLMLRSKLRENEGMLFLFNKDQIVPIWMFGMRIPLDIIWINSDKEVAHIERNVKPCRGMFCSPIYPQSPAKYVLEVNSGASEKSNIHEGSVIDLIDYSV
jgi:uncharacterized protein